MLRFGAVFDRFGAVFGAETIENDAETIENGAETKHLNSTRTARPPKGPGSSSRIQMLKSSMVILGTGCKFPATHAPSLRIVVDHTQSSLAAGDS